MFIEPDFTINIFLNDRIHSVTVISKEPQPQSAEERDILKNEIDEEMKMIDEYKNMEDKLKFENLDIFSIIELSSKFCKKNTNTYQRISTETRITTFSTNG